MVIKDAHAILIVSCRQLKMLSVLLLILTLLQQIPLSAVENPEEGSADYLLDQEFKWLRAEAFVSIATGFAQPIHRAPAIATVITAADMEAMGITELDEALETVPGLHVLRNANLGYLPIYKNKSHHHILSKL